MRILAIETSCDETALCLMEAEGKYPNMKFRILSNNILSQIKIHKPLGGVVPSLAKREHAKHLIPLLKQVLKESKFYKKINKKQNLKSKINNLESILSREPELLSQFIPLISKIKKPPIDAIAVTYGPGLEPALWVGINLARALSYIWNIPIIPANHMEGHIFSALLHVKKIPNPSAGRPISISKPKIYTLKKFKFPFLALLISGGHTEIVLSQKWLTYEIVGETRDDAVGEAFDKVARMLGLPYPGGPIISKLAEEFRDTGKKKVVFPRPMIQTENFDFSFSGLKTSVLYFLKKTPKVTKTLKAEIAHEFQHAVIDVLVTKFFKAASHYKTTTLLVGGGVSANDQIRETIKKQSLASGLETWMSPRELTGDNALMIGVAAYAHFQKSKRNYKKKTSINLKASGSLRL